MFLSAEVCKNYDFLQIVQVVMNVVKLICFVVPIVLIIMASIDLSKNVMSSTEDDMKKSSRIVIKRFIFAVAIFLVPTIVSLTMAILDNIGVKYADCITNSAAGVIDNYKDNIDDTVKENNVNFELNGGRLSSKKKSSGDTVDLDSYVPTKYGYTFDGWYTDKNGGNKVTGSQKSDAKVTYYAHWRAKEVLVAFYRNTGTSDTEKVTQTFIFDEKNQKFMDTGFSDSKDGYYLAGWSNSRMGTVKYKTNYSVTNAFIDSYSPRVNFYAVWIDESNSRAGSGNRKVSINSFIDALDDMSKQVQEDGNWQYNNNNMKSTFDAERNDNRGFSCAKYVVWALQDIKVFDGGQSFFKCYDNCNYTNKVSYSSGAKEKLEKYFKFVDMNNQSTSTLIKDGTLKKGDIVLWYNHQHTNVYAGDGKWYDAGTRYGNWGYSSGGVYYFKTLGPLSWGGYDKVWAVYRMKS